MDTSKLNDFRSHLMLFVSVKFDLSSLFKDLWVQAVLVLRFPGTRTCEIENFLNLSGL